MHLPTIDEFKAAGFGVRITHYRQVDTFLSRKRDKLYMPTYVCVLEQMHMEGHGGYTEAMFFSPADYALDNPFQDLRPLYPVHFGVSHCNPDDAFCKRAGVQLATCNAFGIDPNTVDNLCQVLRKLYPREE